MLLKFQFVSPYSIACHSVNLLIKHQRNCAVSIFCDENEALSAISSKLDGFHVAIVEVMYIRNFEIGVMTFVICFLPLFNSQF